MVLKGQECPSFCEQKEVIFRAFSVSNLIVIIIIKSFLLILPKKELLAWCAPAFNQN
jgi:hypothetical protein